MNGVIVICRSVKDGRRPESTPGFHCAICHEEISATPIGVEQIRQGATPLCNPCGFKVFDKLKMEQISGVVMTPQATEQYIRMMESDRAKNN